MLNIRRALGASLAVVSLLILTACGGANGSSGASQPGQLKIVAAFYPFQFVAERVAGSHGSVESLTQPGAEPHDLELTPKQVASISSADLVVYEKTFQAAVDEAVAQSGNSHVLDTATVVPLQKHEGAGEEHGAEDHDHDHGEASGLDPHVWLDPQNMITITKSVAQQLSSVDAEHAADYTKNADALIGDLTSLSNEFTSGLANCQRTEFITSHAAFGYLAERYKLTQIGINGLSPDNEPSPARIAAVQKEARDHGVTTIFYETLVSPAVAKSIAGDLGLKTDVLDPLEGITAESRGSDYVAVMKSNLTALKSANQCR